MPGVFLSYSRADHSLAERVIRALRTLGVDVWWDEDMPGVDWQEELARQISELAAVIVLWTPASVASKNVRDEARLGQNTEKLVNALVDVSAPPFPFDRVNGLPLDGWNGVDPHGGWSRLVQTVEDHLAGAGVVERGRITGALARREQDVRGRRSALVEAEEAFRAAKAEEEAAADSYSAADGALKAVQLQMQRVMEMGGSPMVVRAAQTDLDAALRVRDAADASRKDAAATLSAAARGLTSTRTALERLIGDASPGAELPPPLKAPPDRADAPATDRGAEDERQGAPPLPPSPEPVAPPPAASEIDRPTMAPAAAAPPAAPIATAPEAGLKSPDVQRRPVWRYVMASIGVIIAVGCAVLFYFNFSYAVSDPAADPRTNWLSGNWATVSHGNNCTDGDYQVDTIVDGKIVETGAFHFYEDGAPHIRLRDGALVFIGQAFTTSADRNTMYQNGQAVGVRCVILPPSGTPVAP